MVGKENDILLGNYLSEWLRWKTQVTAYAGQDVEKQCDF